jgi:hypothetical protein
MAETGLCEDEGSPLGFPHIYIVYFAKLKVPYDHKMVNSTFTLNVSYKETAYAHLAERIAKSISFSNTRPRTLVPAQR